METSTRGSTPVYFYLLIPLVYFLRFGYDYGSSDQDELLSYVLSVLDPDKFRLDPFIQSLHNSFNVRFYFTYLVAGIASLVPLWIAVLLLHLACWIGLVAGVDRLSREWISNELGRLAAITFLLVVSHKWTLGANDLMYHLLTPEPIAWVLIIWAIVFFLRDRLILSGLLAGISIWFHVLAGLLPGIVLGLIILIQERSTGRMKPFFRFVLPAALVSLPMLVPLAVGLSHQMQPTDGPSTFYIQAVLRLSIHHMFFSFHPEMVIRFFVLTLAGVISFVSLKRSDDLEHATFLSLFGGVTLFFCAVAFIGTELVPSLSVARFQFFKLTVLLKTFATILIVRLLWKIMGNKISGMTRLLESKRNLVTIASVLLVIGTVTLGVAGVSRPSQMIRSVIHQQTSLGKIERWVNHNISSDALFAIPPSNTTFRTGAERSVYVNWLGFPFQEPEIHQWYARLQQAAPFEPVARPVRMGPLLDRNYHKKSPAEWTALIRESGITHVLVDSSQLFQPLPYRVLHRQSTWQILQTREP